MNIGTSPPAYSASICLDPPSSISVSLLFPSLEDDTSSPGALVLMVAVYCRSRCKDLHAGMIRREVDDEGHPAVEKRLVSGMAKELRRAD